VAWRGGRWHDGGARWRDPRLPHPITSANEETTSVYGLKLFAHEAFNY
jgi:hypothetical protein